MNMNHPSHRTHGTAARSRRTTRRTFLARSAGAAAAFTIVPRFVLGGPKFVPPSQKVNVALVGAGGQGRENLRGLLQQPDCQVIAVADPVERVNLDAFYYKGDAGRLPVQAEIEKHYRAAMPDFRCSAYEDFRVLLEKERAVDAVLCATPDHLHAYVSIVSMRAGKHVYCEKPLTHNIREARLVAQVARVARETGVATQMGNLGHCRDTIRETCEWIWDGCIGPVREVHVWVRAGRWNKTLTAPPADTPALPAGVNWDLWIGPRQVRPYHPAYHPVTWRDFWDFGTGALGDFGCHDLDAPFWALDLGRPACVEARPAGNMSDQIAPHGEIAYWHYDARGDKPPVKVSWYTGGLMPAWPKELPPDQRLPDRGVLFVGDKGVLLAEGAGGPPRLLPLERTRAYKKPAPSLPRVKGGVHRDWLDACKGVRPACSNFQTAAQLTEVTLLGLVALRTGKRIYWDAENMKARGVDEADAIINGQYRKGWEVA